MTSFAYMSPDASVLIENKEDKPIPTRVLIVQGNDGNRAQLVLTDSVLRELAYHCALYYRERRGAGPLLPSGVTMPTLPPEAAPTPAPAPRMRQRGPVVEVVPPRLPPG